MCSKSIETVYCWFNETGLDIGNYNNKDDNIMNNTAYLLLLSESTTACFYAFWTLCIMLYNKEKLFSFVNYTYFQVKSFNQFSGTAFKSVYYLLCKMLLLAHQWAVFVMQVKLNDSRLCFSTRPPLSHQYKRIG